MNFKEFFFIFGKIFSHAQHDQHDQHDRKLRHWISLKTRQFHSTAENCTRNYLHLLDITVFQCFDFYSLIYISKMEKTA